MDFEKKFPSLNGKLKSYSFTRTSISIKDKEAVQSYALFFLEQDVYEHCLDKQKVKEAIDKIFSANSKTIQNWKELQYSAGFIIHSLSKELGLE